MLTQFKIKWEKLGILFTRKQNSVSEEVNDSKENHVLRNMNTAEMMGISHQITGRQLNSKTGRGT